MEETARRIRRHRREGRAHDWVEDRVRLAQKGDPEAWSELVRRFEGMLRAVVGTYRLPSSEAADVVQTTWLKLAENLDRLQHPSRVGAWLATTARRECVRTLRPNRRSRRSAGDFFWRTATRTCGRHSVGSPRVTKGSSDCSSGSDSPATTRSLLRSACRLEAIGPTRGRALERLRRELERSDRLDDLAA
jgi:RNA polymerase sigma factor (sigma-70 family)